MILLNDPWQDKRQRHEALKRLVGWLITSLFWLFLGIGFGMLLCYCESHP